MAARVPVLATERDTVLHRRDARIKLVLFGLVFAMLYAAPAWPWLAGLAGVGLLLAYIARVPALWLTVLWILQIPSFMGFFLIPMVSELLSAGAPNLGDEINYGLRLTCAWGAALFVSITLFSTMRMNELTDGMRGLRVPEVVCFAIGYAYLLLYLGLNDLFRIVDGLRIKGVDFETKNPYRLARGAVMLFVPVVFTTVRRASTMMGALQQRGFVFTGRRRPVTRVKFDLGDGVALALGVVALAAVLGARFGALGLGA